MNLRTPRHGSEGPSTSHHITSRTTHRRDGASQPLEPLATPRNLLATCLATSQPPETSRNPFRTPLATSRAQRLNLRTPRHGSEGPSTSHHITSRTTHRRDGASQPLEPLATPRNLLATCLATSQPPETSRNPFRTLLQRLARKGRRAMNITSHHIASYHIIPQRAYRRSTGVASRAAIVHNSGARCRWRAGRLL